MRLCTLVILTNTDGTLAADTVGPEATKLNLSLRHALVSEEQPGTEDGLGEKVEDGVGNDLLVDRHLAGAIGNTPNTVLLLAMVQAGERKHDLHRVDGPDDKSETGNGSEELANLATLGHGVSAAVNGEHPDDDEVGDAGNGVPAPLLRSALGAVGSEETGQNHDDISNNGQQDVATAETGEESQVEEEKRGGQAPVNVTGPVDLAVDVVGGVGDVTVRVSDGGAVVADAVAGGHGKVGQRSKGDDEGGDDVVETLGDGDGPGKANEDNHGEEHQDEDGPQSAGAGLGDGLILGERRDNGGDGSDRARGLEGLNRVDNHGWCVD